MLFKDVSEVHNLSVELGKPKLFDRVVKGAINEALKRHRASSSSSSPKGGSGGDEAGLRVINSKDFPRTVQPRACVVDGLVPERHIQRFAVRLNRSAKGTPALTQGVLLGEEHASARSGVNNSATRYNYRLRRWWLDQEYLRNVSGDGRGQGRCLLARTKHER